jgi:tRNA threonylcarbamoyladenosine biosynthesis protein TsaB
MRKGWSAWREPLLAAVAQHGGRVEIMDEPLYPAAFHLLALGAAAWQRGEAVSPEQAAPVYLRNKVV